MDIKIVRLTKRAEKSLKDLVKGNRTAVTKFLFWKREVESLGLDAVKILPGYHDEPLEGKLKGVRSVRLTLGYRCYYRIVQEKEDAVLIDCVLVEEVNKHDYKKIERLFGK